MSICTNESEALNKQYKYNYNIQPYEQHIITTNIEDVFEDDDIDFLTLK